ncbi:unnamed protein product [Schistosoma turkestanicum]|nr:unnamed protein product [Schistosoma turkestanicum]
MELNGVQNQPTDDEQLPNGSLSTGSGSATQDPDLTRPSSTDGSQHNHAPSNQSSNASLSIEERLKRVRAAEQLKQQQRYAAYIEAQQQAEMARMRQQEERKRRIEEMRQKEQTRQLSAQERRTALELSNQARIERLRERSTNRSANSTFRRQLAEHDHSGRTSSASPSLGNSRNPSALMTASCVVAFGSSAPRSILISTRSNSSNECDKIGRLNHHPKITKRLTAPANSSKTIEDTAKLGNMVPPTDSTSSTRSNSIERRLKQSNISVFERLAMSRSVTTGNVTINKARSAPTSASTVHAAKRPENTRESKRNGNSVMPPAMSKSVSGDAPHQHHQKKPLLPSKPLSPPSYPARIQDPETAISSLPPLPQSSSTSESESITQVVEDVSTVSVPCNNSTSSQGNTIKNETPVVVPQIGPIKAETHGSGEGAVLSENEAALYRAKLFEQRRLAKERMEEEQRRLEEENRNRRIQQEQARLAAEAEEARLKEEQAVREAEEAERAKEAEEAARLQAEEAERLEKLRRSEEERVLRKKKLDSIMSRVKKPVSTAKLSSEPTSESGSTTNLQSTDTNQLSSVPDTTCVSPDKFVNQEPATDAQVLETEINVSDTHQVTDGTVIFTVDDAGENDYSSSLEESVNQSSLSQTIIEGDLKDHVNNTLEDHVSSTTTVNGEEVNTANNPPLSHANEAASLQHETQAMDNLRSTMIKNNSSASHSTPLFKSALLQSMLGAGRLSTHAKDAVAGLRRNSSQIQNDQNTNDDWPKNNDQIDSTMSSFYSVNSTLIQDAGDSVNINNSPSVMHSVRNTSMHYQHDLPHFNGSNGMQKSGSPVYLWSDGSGHNASKPDSLSSVPLDTSTH